MEYFIGEISMFGFNFAPRGWMLCAGQILSIGQYTAVFSLLGTHYNGDGQSTFGLPDLRGRTPRGMGQGPGLDLVGIGEKYGMENATLLIANLPTHNHTAQFAQNSTIGTAKGNINLQVNADADLPVSGAAKLNALNTGASSSPTPAAGNVLATGSPGKIYASATTGNLQLGPDIDLAGCNATGTISGTASGNVDIPVIGMGSGIAISSTGSSLPFSLMNPYLGVNFSICIEGIYPSRN